MTEKIHGFTLRSTRELGELNAKFHELEHEKSGARPPIMLTEHKVTTV